ncbi:MAG: spore coat polysaccharide biosynthesis protein SpsF [Solirubrobacteraceae bacterium]|nr:spore coat polysaccharide biosynthesis protein SpsF [Solirubrobacteraceae bacterium]
MDATHSGTLSESRALLARAEGLVPGQSQTMSKGPTQWVQGSAPAYLRRGRGARVQDVDGRWYLDFPMGLGPVILGHACEAVNDAIRRQLDDGITFTLPHPLEVEVAERIRDAVPCAERVRFAKSGSDATTAAIRVARAVTGRDRVIVAGYHGWHDWYIASTSRRRGVPAATQELVEAVPAGDGAALEAALSRRPGEVACVIVEPIGMREPAEGELQATIDLIRRHGALAVFDEVISGFRVALGGAQERYGAVPDLACFGKALGNGMPISALAGRGEVMDVLEDVFFSGTHGGEALSLAAAAATIDVMAAEPVHEHLWRIGRRFQAGVRGEIERHGVGDWVSCGGAAPWTLVTVREPHPGGASLPAKSLLQQEMLRRGVLYNGSNFMTYAHDDADIDEAVAAYGGAFERLAAALPDDVEAHLDGPPVSQVFRPVQ